MKCTLCHDGGMCEGCFNKQKKKNLHSTEEEMVDNKKEREKERMEMHSCE